MQKNNIQDKMRRGISHLFSMPATGVLLALFAIVIASATFIENNQGSLAAKILVYDSHWFMALMVLLLINLSGSIMVNRMVSRKKWSMFLFHASFIIILVGAAVTHTWGTEGTMHSRESESSSHYVTDNNYVSIELTDENETV